MKLNKLLFYGILLALLYIAIECISFAGFFILDRKIFSFPRTFSNRASISQNKQIFDKTCKEVSLRVVHPYIGSVNNPDAYEQQRFDLPFSSYGFLDDKSPIQKSSDEKIILGIFGGSFAQQFSSFGITALLQELRQADAYKDKEIVIVRTALNGFKQPQQLMTLNYLMALGGHFDIVINLDGFNEIVLPIVENAPKRIFPFYPRDWFALAQQFPDRIVLSVVGEMIYLNERKKTWARLFSHPFLRYSITMNLIWKIYNNQLNKVGIYDQQFLLDYQIKEDQHCPLFSPPYDFDNTTKIYKDSAFVWMQSSRQMNSLCQDNGAQYYHFLQPNQDVPDSKIMMGPERKYAFFKNHPYKDAVEQGYPYLTEAGDELIGQGINYYDLTMIFADNNDFLYADTCCHLTKKGYHLLGSHIGKIIVDDQRSQ